MLVSIHPEVYKGKYIATRQRSHTPSHAVPYRIFADVEEREDKEKEVVTSRNNHLMS
jgi:hypothetical protein